MAAEGPIASFPMDREAAEEEIALLVRKPGFDDLTPSDILRHMNNRFNINFDSYKAQLKTMVIEEIRKRNEENDSSDSSDSGTDDDEDDKKKKPSEEKKSKAKEKKADVPEVKKEVKEESDSDSDTGVEDATPKKSSKRAKKTSDFDMISNVKSSRRAAASNAMKQIRNTSDGGRFKSTKKKEKDPNEDNSGRFGRMTKLCYISPELQQVTNDQFMKRCDVVKTLWDYIKEKNLKDPKAGQFILCDDVLESIFKKKRLKGFGMTKYLTRHIIGQSDMTPELREESEREMEKRTAEWLARKRAREAEQLAVIDSGELEGSSAKKIKTEEGDDTNDNDEGGGDVGSSDSD